MMMMMMIMTCQTETPTDSCSRVTILSLIQRNMRLCTGSSAHCASNHDNFWRTWAPAGVGKGALPPGNVVKCFCALVVTVKRLVDELFMHYFYNLSLASGGFAPRLHRGDPEPRWGT